VYSIEGFEAGSGRLWGGMIVTWSAVIEVHGFAWTAFFFPT
jgi:hypothetical protein